MPAAKLTPETEKKIFDLLKRGHYRNEAAAFAGIHKDTLYGWIERGNEGRAHQATPPVREQFDSKAAYARARAAWRAKLAKFKPYMEFVDGLEHASDYGEAWLVEQIIEMCTDSSVRHNKWTGLMTILERTRRDRWGRRSVTEHATPDGKPFPVSHVFDPSKLSTDELAALQLMLEKARPEES